MNDHANPPAVVIELPLEEPPRIRIHCANHSEEQRIREWITSDEDRWAIVAQALELARERRAA